VPDHQILECEEHGDQAPAYVCRHLLKDGKRHPLGLFEADYDPDTNQPTEYRMAWCKGCDDILHSEREWSESATAFAGPVSICGACFKQILQTQMKLNPLDVKLNENDI
jgi:hypothetical protein